MKNLICTAFSASDTPCEKRHDKADNSQEFNGVVGVVLFNGFWFVGQSRLDFLFDFVEESGGLFQGFDVLETRPRPGKKKNNKKNSDVGISS